MTGLSREAKDRIVIYVFALLGASQPAQRENEAQARRPASLTTQSRQGAIRDNQVEPEGSGGKDNAAHTPITGTSGPLTGAIWLEARSSPLTANSSPLTPMATIGHFLSPAAMLQWTGVHNAFVVDQLPQLRPVGAFAFARGDAAARRQCPGQDEFTGSDLLPGHHPLAAC